MPARRVSTRGKKSSYWIAKRKTSCWKRTLPTLQTQKPMPDTWSSLNCRTRLALSTPNYSGQRRYTSIECTVNSYYKGTSSKACKIPLEKSCVGSGFQQTCSHTGPGTTRYFFKEPTEWFKSKRGEALQQKPKNSPS